MNAIYAIFWASIGAVTNTAVILALARIPHDAAVPIGLFWIGATLGAAFGLGLIILADRRGRS